MKTQETEFKPAGQFARGAAINAVYRDRENRLTYTPKQQAQAETFRDLAGIAFPTSECFINYRKQFIAVKISKPGKARMISSQAQMFEVIMQERGAKKIVTDTSIVYRVPRQ